ncbi:MAG TPA: RluA family pseudouridine synthase [Holophagaceae bacterium]|nr:RluA family pseudouridine synthase [Holophagaceae bacterium]
MSLNAGFTYTEIIGGRGAGLTVLAYLASRHGHTDEAGWRARILEGRVLVDGQPAEAGARLRAGQSLAWIRPPWEEPDVPLAFEVLYEDEDLVAVAKPTGLPTLPGAGFLEHTLLHQVRLRFPGASPSHRLGRGTTGIVLFTRNEAAGRIVSAAWREHRVTKVYRALVMGRPEQDAFAVETPIGRVAHAGLGQLHAADPAGKASRSDVAVLERRSDSSLVDVAIATGRPHQIRIHMAASGHPLVGDPLYAAGGHPIAGAVPGDLGYLLHARLLSLVHPRTGELLTVECPPPAALRTMGGDV